MISFKVTNDSTGEEYEVTADTRDILKWEAESASNLFANLQDKMRMADLYSLAFHALRRTGQITVNRRQFEDKFVVALEVEEVEEAQDPTR